jgi:hypothetical protein
LVHAVTLRAVQDNNIKTSINKLLETKLVLGTGANGSSAEELLAIRKLRGIGEVLVLGQIGSGDHGDDVEVLVDDRELALLGLGENLVGFEEGDVLRSSDKVSNHDIGNGLVEVLLKLEVSVGNDTQELGTNLAIGSNWETTETPLLLQSLGLANGGVAINDNGVEDETVLVTLDLADHVGLGFRRAVVVNNTKTTLESHVDGHLVLCDSVHRGRDEGGLEGDTLGDRRIERDFRGSEANVAGEEQEVIVGKTTVLGCIHKLVDVEAILHLVLISTSRAVVWSRTEPDMIGEAMKNKE